LRCILHGCDVRMRQQLACRIRNDARQTTSIDLREA